ncbi:MAG: hypothetical protein EP329_17700 [Deltaproteobacteria bacterium]|nr:MAG: hypothetical protein EP329_17700 [Deltaproteobacteria bacterium]
MSRTSRPSIFRVLAVLLLVATVGACQRPESVVQDAAAAARAGDRAGYAACFTARSRPILEAFWMATDQNNPTLSALGASDVEIRGVAISKDRNRDVERAIVSVSEGGDRMRVVLHRTGGNWRIDLLDTESMMMSGSPLD